MNFLGGATSLDSFLKAYKTSETKGFFLYECFDHPDKMQNPELPPYDAFYSKLRSCNPLETEYTDYVNLLKSGLTTEQAVIKLKLSNPPPTGIENYHYLQQIWKQEQLSSFKDFLRWYNNKDVVPTLEATQKMIAFYHDKDIDMLKLGCTLPNMANICLHKSTDAKFYPFTEGDKDLLKNSRRCHWWPIYRFYTQSSCWNFYPKVYKHMQIYCLNCCQPTIPLLDVPTHAHRSLHALGYRFRNQ